MPTYEYECPQCSARFEMRQGFTEDTSATCPRCGSEAIRIFWPVPIIFKGSGFYVTDSRNKPESSPLKGSTKKAKTIKEGG